jgi:hemoglobin-like flavoprotein
MTPEQASLITKSFDEMWPVRRVLAGKFYTRFFEAMPDARRLFPNDMEKQHRKLMDTIAAIVGAASNQPLCRSIVSNTARQHARFGVTSSQLAAFGDALITSPIGDLRRQASGTNWQIVPTRQEKRFPYQ